MFELNTCDETAFSLYLASYKDGRKRLSEAAVRKIIEGRPFSCWEDVVRHLSYTGTRQMEGFRGHFYIGER